MKHLYCFLFAVIPFSLFAQVTQTVRGTLYDEETRQTIVGATVLLINDSSSKPVGAVSDISGNFKIENVPVGRRAFLVKMVGYKEQFLNNVIVSSGKEVILNLYLESSVSDLKEVVIKANKQGGAINEMAFVSSRVFSVEETDRYAGSRGDPGRMASNFAGVQGADDSRNDIVIRGNSPMGLLWRVEGVDLPNPNHFAVAGTAGGGVSLLNNKMFANSDFFTGAFPAEYGNANAGVFDIRFRNGNNQKRETTFQLGFLGTELSTEGPINKEKGSSYLLTYRYSTLKLFEGLNISLGTSAVPNYQDLAFKVNFPTEKLGNFALFGLAGTSRIDILLSETDVDTEELYGQNDRDQVFSTSMAVTGITHSKTLNEKSFIRTTFAGYLSNAWAHHDLFYRDSVTLKVDTMFPKLRYNFNTNKVVVNSAITTKLNIRNTYKVGIIAEQHFVNLVDSNYLESVGVWDNREGAVDNTSLLRSYFQWKYKYSDELAFTAGLHGLYFALNNSYSIEPRIAMRWNMAESQVLSLGAGMHSQLLPLYVYYHHSKNVNNEFEKHNQQLDLSRSLHNVASYEYVHKGKYRFKTELYYQYLYNIPVDTFSSSFSLVNQGSQFSRFFPGALTNKGTAFNYGAELTVERFFNKGYFYMLTASVYESKYKGSDGILRDSDYNGKFALNVLGTKEWEIDKTGNKVLVTGIKTTWAGGRRYSPPDTAASRFIGELVALDSLRNSKQFRDYFRLDLKLGIRINGKKVAHELAFDLVNILNTQNVLGLTYAPDPSNPSGNPIRQEYQLGFLPLFYYKVDF